MSTYKILSCHKLKFEVEALKHGGYVTADLAFGNTKFMGVCRPPFASCVGQAGQ